MFRSWWQQIRKSLRIIGISVVCIFVVGLIFIEVRLYGTGFIGKTLWDWLNLLGVLAIPVVVGLGAAWYTAQQGKVSDRENTDNQRETALQAYIDKMSELLLVYHLRDSKVDDEVRKIARVRTITILFQLDARRIGYVFSFLRETGLMSNKQPTSIVSLSQANLNKINLSQANLIEADLREANLHGANLIETNLYRANLREVILLRANLREAILGEADLTGANLIETNLRGAFLHGADLQVALLREANLSQANLYRANLREASLIEANLHAANLSEADLSEANLSRAYLQRANLSGANLSGANLSRAYLQRANLSGANLSGANLSGANLSHAIFFSKIYVPRAFSGTIVLPKLADLSGADLSQANLRGAKVTTEQLNKVKSFKGAIMPDGTKHA